MRIAVVDTETTGMSDQDQVVEVGIVSWRWPAEFEPDDAWSSLVRPTCPVSMGARAVHHISDSELNDSLTMQALLQQRGLPELGVGSGDIAEEDNDYLDEEVVMVAHNLAFDRKMLVQSGLLEHRLPKKQVCTWQCAKHLYPDSEDGYSNQVLRYYLGLVVPQLTTLPPHRALPDALVTAALVQHMLMSKTPDELVRLTTTPVNLALKKVKFGKYKGMLWKDLPSDYLDWIIRQVDFDEDGRHTARVVRSGRRQPLLQP
jgi:exodeoxyribonuclease X